LDSENEDVVMKLTRLMVMGMSVACTSAFATGTTAESSNAQGTKASAAPAAVTAAATSTNSNFATDIDRISYSLGADMGINLHKNGVEVNPKMLEEGLAAGLSGGSIKLSDKEMEDTLVKFQQLLEQKSRERFEKMATENKSTGDKFLQNNKQQPGVSSLPNGLQYKIIEKGTGTMPKATDVVTVNYEGRFPDGKVFDSSYQRKQPATFPLNQVIKGWQEALQIMPIGSTWEIYVPANLAYGEQGIGGVIGPNQTLIFKINLLSIKEKEKDTKTAAVEKH
jgi:FKBP-type peptidyl-prolyl cis-trans isomerase FklB